MRAGVDPARRTGGLTAAARLRPPDPPSVLCAPEWLRRAALGGLPPLPCSPHRPPPDPPSVLCAPEWIRRAALGGLPPLRGFAPQTPQACYARRSGSGAPHWGAYRRCAASPPRPPKRAMRAGVDPARRTGGLTAAA